MSKLIWHMWNLIWYLWILNCNFENEFDGKEDQIVHFEFDIATCETQTVTFAVQFANVENQFALF